MSAHRLAHALIAPLRDTLSYRNRPELFALIIYNAITVIGFMLLMPLVSVHFVTDIGMSASFVGFTLALRQFSQQGLTFIGGILADKYGLKPILCLGLCIRAIGFFLLGIADDKISFFVGLLLSGLGGALFDAPFAAAIVALTYKEERSNFYLIINYVISLAGTLGPLLAFALLPLGGFTLIGVLAGGCFLINMLVALRYFPNRPAREESKQNADTEAAAPQWQLLLKDRTYLRFMLILAGYWFIVMQSAISFPLLAEAITGKKNSVSLYVTINAIVTLLLQYHLVRLLQRRFNTHQLLIFGAISLTIGTSLIGISPNYAVFLFFMMFNALGYLISRPMIDILVAHLANPKALGLYMGISGASLGIGGGLGNFIGGWLYNLGQAYHLPALPWSVFGVIGILTIWQLYQFFCQFPEFKTH